MKLNEQKSLMLSLVLAVMTTAAWAGEGFSVVQSTRQIPERGEVKSANINDGSLSVSFILPIGWRLGSNGDAVVLQSQDFGARIELRRVINGENRGTLGTTVREYSLFTSAGDVKVIDSHMAVEGGLRVACRTVVIEHDGHFLEIAFTGSPENMVKHQKLFDNLVASLRLG